MRKAIHLLIENNTFRSQTAIVLGHCNYYLSYNFGNQTGVNVFPVIDDVIKDYKDYGILLNFFAIKPFMCGQVKITSKKTSDYKTKFHYASGDRSPVHKTLKPSLKSNTEVIYTLNSRIASYEYFEIRMLPKSSLIVSLLPDLKLEAVNIKKVLNESSQKLIASCVSGQVTLIKQKHIKQLSQGLSKP